MLTEQVRELESKIPQLGQRDREFAHSLCSQYSRKGLSAKQAEWVGILLNRATAPAPQPVTVQVGSLQPIVAMLERAKQHLKFPAILVRVNDRDLRLNIAGPKSSEPGSINVCSAGAYSERDWFGRVSTDGAFEPCRKYDPTTQAAIAAALNALASDPAGAAAAYGHLTGNCAFCGTALTDGRSTEVGYGPTCAKHYGIPWGKTVAKKAA
jgi:hypothetical protein